MKQENDTFEAKCVRFAKSYSNLNSLQCADAILL